MRRSDPVVRPTLVVDWDRVEPLTLDPAQTPISAEIAPALGGATNLEQVHVIDLTQLPEEFRLQRLVFRAAQKSYASMQGRFKGNREYLLSQLVNLIDSFVRSEKVAIDPPLFNLEPLRRPDGGCRQAENTGAGEGSRTLVTSLGS